MKKKNLRERERNQNTFVHMYKITTLTQHKVQRMWL